MSELLINIPPPPLTTPIVDRDGLMTRAFNNWLLTFSQRTSQSSPVVASDTLTTQSASIGLTAFVTQATGFYRVSWHYKVTQAATTSNSFQIAWTATSLGITCTQTGTASTGNTTATVQSGSFLVLADQGTTVSYQVTYASVGATPMQFALTLFAEALPS